MFILLSLTILLFTNVIAQNKDAFCGAENCYDILNVPESSTKSEISKAYRDLASEYHPDKQKGDDAEKAKAEEMMKRINMANDVLSSAPRRKNYDAMLQLRRNLDSPKENPFFVFIALYLLLSFIVLQYKKQTYRVVKKELLKRPKIKRDITQPKIELDGKKNKKSKKKKKEDIDENLDLYDDNELNELIKKHNLKVSGWEGGAPTFSSACVAVAKSPMTITCGLFNLCRRMCYHLIGYELTDADKEEACRIRFNLDKATWYSLDDEEKKDYLRQMNPKKNN